jgi:hypothetical protein
MAQGGGQGELIGLVHLDYRGTRLVLGRTADAYAIWDAAGGPPRQTFPLSDDGWIQAWQEYQRLEASAAWTAPAAGPPGPGGMAPGGGPGVPGPGGGPGVPGGMAPGAEAYALDYPGGRYGLGRAQGQYIIWDLQTQAGVRAFPLTDEGWAEAWRTFRELDEPFTFVPTTYWQKGRPIPIRAMRAGQIIGGGFKLYFMHFWKLILLSATILVPFNLVTGALTLVTGELVEPEPGSPMFGTYGTLNGSTVTWENPMWVDLLNSFLGQTALWAAAGVVVGALIPAFLGRPLTVGEAFRSGFRWFPRVIGGALLASLAIHIVLLPPVAVRVAQILGTESTALSALLALAIVAVIVPLIFVYVRVVLTTAAGRAERLGSSPAVRRSWNLVRGLWWKQFGNLLLSWLIVGGVFVVVFLIFVFIALAAVVGDVSSATSSNEVFVPFFIGSYITILVLVVLLEPFLLAVIALLYFDARVRKEGFSEQVLAREWEAQSPSGISPGVAPPPAGLAPPPGP